MRNFSQIITEPYKDKDANTNEVVGVLFASAALAYACAPLLTSVGEAIKKKAEQKSKDGFSFWDWIFGRKKDKEDPKKSNDEPKTNPKKSAEEPKTDPKKSTDEPKTNPKKSVEEQNKEDFNSLMIMAKKSNKNEKDKNVRKKNDSLIKIIDACSFDENGNELPVEERMKKLKSKLPKEQFEQIKGDLEKTYNENKDKQEIKDSIIKAKKNIKKSEYDETMDKAKKESKITLEKLDKAIKQLQNDLDELKKNTDNKENDDVKKDKDGNILKQEKVKDPETGKKISVVTHTGPRGGKFYYPDGKPKNSENKVYVKEGIDISFQDYIKNSL